jgi:hypothetical protein
MMTPETLAAAERVSQHGAQRAMLAARNESPDVRPDGDALPAAPLPGLDPEALPDGAWPDRQPGADRA